jgi:acyl-CoA hydrolase
MERRDKTVAESKVETFHIILPEHMNDSGRLFGGTLMCWIDEVAGLVGRRHAQMNVTTGTVDNLRFLRGAYLRDIIVISGKVTHVANASMEVKVESFVERTDGERELINRAFLTMVGIDENNKPCRLPRLLLQTGEDRREWQQAEVRRVIRRKQREEGIFFFED